jgi:type II secretory ATPase GspE/PulE/Tfp pilus assembly ATPase PilB-like protein
MAKKKNFVELPDIELFAAGDQAAVQDANLARASEHPGFASMCMMLADVFLRRADVAVFDYTAQGVSIKYQIDGLWHPMAPMDREFGDSLLEALKLLGGGSAAERRARQDLKFQAIFKALRYKLRVVSQGVKTGERVGLYVDFKRPPRETVDDLGMREGMRDALIKLLKRPESVFVSVGMPGEGVTSIWRAMLLAADRFTHDFFVVEDKASPEPELINVTQATYNAAAGETPMTHMRTLLLREPHVIAFPALGDGSLLDQMDDIMHQYKIQLFTRVNGKTAIDGLRQLLELKADRVRLAKNLGGLVSMRVLRKLCTHCRLEFPPSAEMLQKLEIPPGRVRALYRSYLYRGDEVDERGQPIPPCPKCMGTGFLGRTGLFELLQINDDVRKAIAAGRPFPEIQKIILDGHHITMRQEAVLLIAKGITSVEEVQRVMAK